MRTSAAPVAVSSEARGKLVDPQEIGNAVGDAVDVGVAQDLWIVGRHLSTYTGIEVANGVIAPRLHEGVASEGTDLLGASEVVLVTTAAVVAVHHLPADCLLGRVHSIPRGPVVYRVARAETEPRFAVQRHRRGSLHFLVDRNVFAGLIGDRHPVLYLSAGSQTASASSTTGTPVSTIPSEKNRCLGAGMPGMRCLVAMDQFTRASVSH